MADFIAVIRRAVDGLSDNTPEMRVKVYERARAAVVRQLENMKPQPPEAMFKKQLDKLDAAIREVESEHAPALPATGDEPEVSGLADQLPEPAENASTEDTPTLEAEREPVSQISEPPQVSQSEDAAEQEAPFEQHAETVEEPSSAYSEDEQTVASDEAVQEEQVYDDAPVGHVAEQIEEPVDREEIAVAEVQSDEQFSADQDAGGEPAYYPDEQHDSVVEEPSEPSLVETRQEEFAEASENVVYPERTYPEELPEEPSTAALVRADDGAAPFDETAEMEPVAPAPDIEAQEPTADEAPPMPRVSYDENDVVSGFNAFVQEEMNRQVVPPPPGKKIEPQAADFSWDAPFDDLPDMPRPEAFDQALKAKQDELAHAPPPDEAEEPIRDPRAELEQLIGFDPYQKQTEAAMIAPEPDLASVDGALPTVNKRDAKPFNLPKENRRKGSVGRLILTAAITLITAGALSGAAYGVWYYRDDVSKLIASLMPENKPEKPAAKQASDAQTKPQAEKQPEKQAAADKNETEVASLDPAAPQKFTQRLLPNGKETSSDTPQVPVDQALIEGKSVAEQTEKPKEVAQTGTANTNAGTQPTVNTGVSDTNVAASAIVGSGEKMFLYEERLGQGTPVASPGTVSWSEKSDQTDGKPMPSIEAQVTVPGRKMKAIISFKKNGDASLPASHVIEIVFDLPKDFEEGNVEGVQKVAFKLTEQDAGNPLIAVPAKITDDFHMVALNSDVEAQKVNIDLMKSRSWIDIPITYRNGRRGLLTLEKGKSGDAIFQKVINEWGAIGSASVDQ